MLANMETTPVVGVYHKDCVDGTTAAAVVLRKYPHAQVFPLSHAYTPEDITPIVSVTTADTALYFVDCAIGVREFLARGNKATVLDHHIGIKDEFEALAKEDENLTFIFDNEKSGASLAWSYFFPDADMPELIKYVEDADLWRHVYGDTTARVSLYLSLHLNDPKRVLALMEGDLEMIERDGEILRMSAKKEVERQVRLDPVRLRVGDHVVHAFNITQFESACGNLLSEKMGQAVALFTVKGKRVKLSFRSKEGQMPTALSLAKELGGGGHAHASGADIPLPSFLKNLVL